MSQFDIGRAAAVAVAVLGCFSAAAIAQQAAPSGAATKADELQEIVVTGIRASLEQAADIKRNADVIVDSIAAEDLGKFPDANVAEALQRVTGVAISRNNFGEGQQITVRGLGPQFVTVLVNGRMLPTSTNSRSFNFDTLPAELISGADLYKSTTATLQDGGIGALMNLKTPRPLDHRGARTVLSVKGEYEDLSSKTAPQAFALFSDTFAENTIGALVSLSYQKRDVRTNDASSQGGFIPNNTVAGLTGVSYPQGYNLSVVQGSTTRKGLTGVLQFKPTDQLLLSVDAMWDRYQLDTRTAGLAHFLGPSNIASATIDSNRTVTSLTTNNFGHTDFVSQYDRTPTTITAFGFNADWKSAGGLLDLNLDLSGSRALSDGPNNTAFAVIGYRNVVSWSYSGSGIPSVVALGDPRIGVPPDTFTDPSLGHAHFARRGTNRWGDAIREGRLDGVMNVDAGGLSKLKFGAYFSSRNKDDDTWNSNFRAAGAYGGYNLPIPASVGLLSEFNAGSSFLSGHGGTIPTQWLTFDPDAYFAYLSQPSAAAAQDQILRLAPGTTLARLGSTGFTAVKQAASYTVREKVRSFYLGADFAGMLATLPWSANLGVRYAHTQLSASGNSLQLADLLPVPNDLTTYLLVYANGGALLPVAADNTYNNVLPSLNAKLQVTDTVIARLALSKSLARPNITDLAPQVSIDNSRPGNLTASGGNPDLRPYTSNNADLSLEWYYSHSGYLTAGLFYKDIQDFVISKTAIENFPVANAGSNFSSGFAPFVVRRPRNGPAARVKGLEVAFQHTFDYLPSPFNGLGLMADATFVKSNATLDPGQMTQTFALEGLGNTQNVVGFYEKGPVGLRVAYNHRDTYVQTAVNTSGEPIFVKGAGQLDFQVSYKIREHIELTADGSNVTGTARQQFGRYSNQFVDFLDTGARYGFGVRVKL